MDLKIMAGQLYNQYIGKEAKIKYINGEDQELIGKKGELCVPYASSFGSRLGLRLKDMDIVNLLEGDIVEIYQSQAGAEKIIKEDMPEGRFREIKSKIKKEKSLTQAKREVIQEYKDKYEAIRKRFIGKYFISDGFICLAKEYIEIKKRKFIDVFMYDNKGKMIERHNVGIDNFYLDTPVYRDIENTPLFTNKKIYPVVKDIKDPLEEKIKKLYDKADNKRKKEAINTYEVIITKPKEYKKGEISFTFYPKMFNIVKSVKHKINLYAVLFNFKDKQAVCTDDHKLQILNIKVKGDISDIKEGKILIGYEYKNYFKEINTLSNIDYKDNTCILNDIKISFIDEGYPKYMAVIPKEKGESFIIKDKNFYKKEIDILKKDIYYKVKQKYIKDSEATQEDQQNAFFMEKADKLTKAIDINYYISDNLIEAKAWEGLNTSIKVDFPLKSKLDLKQYIDLVSNTQDNEFTVYNTSNGVISPVLLTSLNTINVIMPVRL